MTGVAVSSQRDLGYECLDFELIKQSINSVKNLDGINNEIKKVMEVFV